MNTQYISESSLVAQFIAEAIKEKLKEGSVLWLVPGGSNIAVVAEVANLLAGHDLSHLTVSLTDERFGTVDHPDSNWRQLREAGAVFEGARLVPVLYGADRHETVRHYGETLHNLFSSHGCSIGFFGIGADGHTAGILPHSVASHENIELACGYDAGNFERITMTPPAIRLLTKAIAYATGESKAVVLDGLQKDIDVVEMPAQLLKSVQDFTLFRDGQE